MGTAPGHTTMAETASWIAHENVSRVLSFRKIASPCSWPSLFGLNARKRLICRAVW